MCGVGVVLGSGVGPFGHDSAFKVSHHPVRIVPETGFLDVNANPHLQAPHFGILFWNCLLWNPEAPRSALL